MTTRIEFAAYIVLLLALPLACSSPDGPQPITNEPGETEAERQARLDSEAEYQKEQEAEEAARVAALERKELFCTGWAELACKGALSCHPSLTEEILTTCQTRERNKCVDRMPEDWNDEGATACFEAGAQYACEIPLEEFFIKNCGAVLGDGAAVEGEDCAADVSCAVGLYCEKGENDGSCRGSCAVPAKLGEDCEDTQCKSGLDCTWSTDSGGFKVARCAQKSAAPAPTVTCEPYQFLTESGACLLQALPGGNCRGDYNVPCLYSSCDANSGTGTCKYLPNNAGKSCSDQSQCAGAGRCLADFDGQNGRCTGSSRTCYADHPLMLR